MFKLLIIVLLLLGLGVWIGLRTEYDPGYLLVAYQDWTAEMPLWAAAIGVLLVFLVLQLLFSVLRYVFSSKRRVKEWNKHRLQNRAHCYTTRGMLELAEGHWDKAEENLIKGVERSDTPILNYLMAAQVAQEQGSPDRRDDYLRLAHEATENSELAIGLTQAQLQFRYGQLEEALATLRHLQTLAPKHQHVLKLLQKVYVRLQEWEPLQALLPVLRKQHLISNEEAASIEKQMMAAKLPETAKTGDSEALIDLWAKSSTAVQEDVPLIKTYVKLLCKKEAGVAAEHVLRFSLKRFWHDDLVAAYGEVESADIQHQLKHAESWQKAHPNSAALHFCIARLALRNQLWGKARTHLETAIDIEPTRASYAALGQLLEQLGEGVAANEAYQQAATLK